jgi:hypothetical protein
MVVTLAPIAENFVDVHQRNEVVLVEARVPQPAIKALAECVLNRLARRNVVETNTAIGCPT